MNTLCAVFDLTSPNLTGDIVSFCQDHHAAGYRVAAITANATNAIVVLQKP